MTLTSISDWANRWLVTMNESKEIYFSVKREKPVHLPLILNNNFIEHAHVTVHEQFGLTFI